NGVAYSYDVRIGGFDENGALSLSQVIKNEGNFSNGLYSVQFEVNRFEQDNLTKEPHKAFTSPLTGVVNQENETLKETYLTDGILFPWDWFNTTDYKIRHIKVSSDGNDIYKWVNNNANGTDYDSIHGKDDGVPIGFESNTLFHDLGVNDFYYLSFKELLVDAFRANYGDTFSRSYAADKGIVHVTPGIYRIKTSIGINSPDDSKATGQTKFEDRQLMFVMANVANGGDSKLLSAQHIIPHIGKAGTDSVAERYFTFDRTSGHYVFNFALQENDSWLIENNEYRRDIRIVLLEKNGSSFSNFTFFTLTKEQGNLSNQYQFAVPAGYFETQSDGRYSKPTLRIAWYDDVARHYAKYTGINEEELVRSFWNKNSQDEQAVRKVFMVGSQFGEMTALGQRSKVEEFGEEPNFDLDNPSVVEDVPVDLNSPSYFAPLNPFDQWEDSWYECTRYAFGRTHEKTGTVLTFSQNTGRNGGRWYDLVNNPDLEKGSEPRSNSLAVWEYGEYGHVAFVEEVDGDKVIISEANWASPTDGKYNGFKEFTKDSIKQRGNYQLIGYI
ncbi:MAG TPA: CHAP domain-containing protein, partial [Methylophaga sp.]|nr:CHAP domain-containing protein [Methylophaga sp.]